jgi:hypothetical protein
MADSHDVLLDDGAVVQLLRHVVARGSREMFPDNSPDALRSNRSYKQ